MKIIEMTNQFKRDIKKHYLSLVSHNWIEVIHHLIHDEPLPIKYQDHQLQG